MENIPWGLYMTLAGMGTVFLLLLALMAVLMGIGRLDRPKRTQSVVAEPEPATADLPEVESTEPDDPSVLSPELIAAITVAVITHAKIRRGQGAAAMRQDAPGSHLFASRWVSIGRAYQNQPWK